MLHFDVECRVPGHGDIFPLRNRRKLLKAELLFDDIANRREVLRHYFEIGDLLREQVRHAALLSVDVVNSHGLKKNEDQLNIEFSFGEFHRMVERSGIQHKMVLYTWAGDGAMCLFPTVELALSTAGSILEALPAFNKTVSRLRHPFKLRMGIHSGDIPLGEKMEEIFCEVVDVCGHVQKAAAENRVWLSEEAYSELTEPPKCEKMSQTVDGHAIWEMVFPESNV